MYKLVLIIITNKVLSMFLIVQDPQSFQIDVKVTFRNVGAIIIFIGPSVQRPTPWKTWPECTTINPMENIARVYNDQPHGKHGPSVQRSTPWRTWPECTTINPMENMARVYNDQPHGKHGPSVQRSTPWRTWPECTTTNHMENMARVYNDQPHGEHGPSVQRLTPWRTWGTFSCSEINFNRCTDINI